jgi:hypothetical protein
MKDILRPLPPEPTTLFRAVGQAELELIRARPDSVSSRHGCRRRLSSIRSRTQTMPSGSLATGIRKDPASGFVGYVVRFSVRTKFLSRYEIHTVGDSHHREYWIPAADLPSFHDNLVGPIEVVSEFRANGSSPDTTA